MMASSPSSAATYSGQEGEERRAGTIDPRYEFVAPRYHDFTARECTAEDAERADEWFGLLNAGLIDTDLTTPTSTQQRRADSRAALSRAGVASEAKSAEEANAWRPPPRPAPHADASASESNRARTGNAAVSSSHRAGAKRRPSAPATHQGGGVLKRMRKGPGLTVTVPRSPMLHTRVRARVRPASKTSSTAPAKKALLGFGARMRTRASARDSPAFRTRLRSRVRVGRPPAGAIAKGGLRRVCRKIVKRKPAGHGVAFSRRALPRVPKPRRAVSASQTTKPQPFALRGPSRSAKVQAGLQREAATRSEEEKRRRVFKARPVPLNTYAQSRRAANVGVAGDAGKVGKVGKVGARGLRIRDANAIAGAPPTGASKPFALAGEKRAQDRLRFNEEQRAARAQQAEAAREEEAAKKRREAAEIKAYRKTLEFKAAPIRYMR